MSARSSSNTTRHALMLALLYLLIRGTPELAAGVWGLLPDVTRVALLDSPFAWLRYVFPPLPGVLLGPLPFSFQSSLNGWSSLFIEVLLAFLIAAWCLRHYAVAGLYVVSRKAWVVMGVATLLWAVVLRQGLFWLLSRRQLIAYESGLPYDELAALSTHYYWSALPLFYLSTIVWAWLPVWLHLRALRRQQGHYVPASGAVMAASLKRACVWGGFVLGFLLLHTAFLQGFFMGLWPWLADVQNIILPYEELQQLGAPLILSQLVVPAAAGLLAGYWFSRNAGSYHETRLQLMVLPLIAGAGTLALANLVFLALLWLLAYASYGLLAGLLMGLAYQPHLAYVVLALVNIGGVVVLCAVAVFLRGSRTHTALKADPV